MRLWTIKCEAAFRKFERDGVLKGDGRRGWTQYRYAYRWMMGQMEIRIGQRPSPRCGAIWAWTASPDLRAVAQLPRGTAGVRIVLEIDTSKVLLSDFDDWHAVLCYGYLPGREEEDTYDPDADRTWEEIEKSWERIFDLKSRYPDYPDLLAKKFRVQATMWQIEWPQVRKVQRFIAR